MSALHHLATLRALEAQGLAAGLPLMERAGAATVRLIAVHYLQARRILVIVGPGNNGGDGLVAARLLQEGGRATEVWFTRGTTFQGDAEQAYQRWQAQGIRAPDLEPGQYDLILDALYGIGLNRVLDARDIALIDALNACHTPIVALDVPSGLNAMTGAHWGAAIRARHTLSFLGLKPGLFTGEGRDHCGMVEPDLLGLDLPAADARLLDRPPAALRQLHRPHNNHKGRFGTVGIVGGANGMTGAALLAGRAALLCGAGRVLCGFVDVPPTVDLLHPELMLQAAQSLAHDTAVSHWLIGPGLGQSDAAHTLLAHVLESPHPVVLDADALNLIARHPPLQTQLAQRRSASILTPHPAEAARLLGENTATIQHDRITAARELAQRYRATVILKGSGSIIADTGSYSINASGNAALSNAGQGDVLGGVVLALLAQGLSARAACECGAWLHGAAADEWQKSHPAGIGLTASEVALIVRDLLNRHVCGDDAGL